MHFYYAKDSRLSLEQALDLEWLETNGLGSYASSTILNCNTRKYHGLLVSAVNGLADKYVLLNKIEDLFLQGNTASFLTTHLYPNYCQDGGFANFYEFRLVSHPCWSFKFSNLEVTKELLMVWQENTLLFKYHITGGGKGKISLRPLFACRNFHRVQQENPTLDQRVELLPDGFCFTPYPGLPTMFFQMATPYSFLLEPRWYHNFLYPKEQERGYEFAEDLFSPGVLVCEFDANQEIIGACSISRQTKNLALRWQQELKRRDKHASDINIDPNISELQRQLHLVGDSFITTSIYNKKAQTVGAGYHWFLEWGRDALIALPGLTLYSGREELLLNILKNFAGAESRGLIPNMFGKDHKSHAYNTVDASLWFGWAIQQYYLKTKNLQTVITYFWATLKNIFNYYREGTLYNIKMQNNGLIYAGHAELNLTWMDAMVDGKPVTPRYGYPVEVNALWFNLLSFMLELAKQICDPLALELQSLVVLTQTSFRQTFWCEEQGYLYDFVNNAEKNRALRPNQIFAVSLPYSPLLIKTAVSVVAAVKEHLLTPYGLRSLAPHDPAYTGCYHGNQHARDQAYHNGTVWPWLLGPFTEALLKVTADRRKVVAIIQPCLAAFQQHLAAYGVGSIAEIFSGDFPHLPDGCISQAWSVAELLRVTYLLHRSTKAS